jgi:cyclophilin family peptidyl-prolyl cis-trans isomerase
MRPVLLPLAMLALSGQAPVPPPKVLSPGEIVASAPTGDWVEIAASDLLVMDLAGNRRVIIQLMPPPFSQGWVGNIRKLAAARFWDGTSINRVQDNYVVQWGDANAEDKAKAKKLPDGLAKVQQIAYTVDQIDLQLGIFGEERTAENEKSWREALENVGRPPKSDLGPLDYQTTKSKKHPRGWRERDAFSNWVEFHRGWPLGSDDVRGPGGRFWPVHCYGMVGVGRDMPPDTGTGAELYTVIGHAPRHLDRNIALVGRVIAGIEHLSSLPRGTGALGFYEKPEQRTGIVSVRMGNEVADLPRYQYLSTESTTFARYADARANRRDAFFIVPAGGADICNVPVPVRVVK